MGSRHGCRFFMPDPWSFEEDAFPPKLNDLLALPRYVAQNYLDINYKQAFLSALRLARFFAPPNHWPLLTRLTSRGFQAVLSTGLNVQPHPEMKLGLMLCDAILGMLFHDRQPGEAFVLMNGLKQINVHGKGFQVYRQRTPQQAIEAIGVSGGRVEQCMTHDATILFNDADLAQKAFELLECTHLSDGHKAFYVERQGPDRVFYQLAFEHAVSADTRIVSGGYSQPFYEVFQLVCERTGAHVPEGDVFSDGVPLPDCLDNHEIFEHVVRLFHNSVPGTASPPKRSDRQAA